MRSHLRRSRVLLITVAFVWALALHPDAAGATYTGVQDTTTFGTVAAGGGWIVVPQYAEDNDPGEIDGTPFSDTTSSLEVARASGPRQISFRSVSASYSVTMGPMLLAGAEHVLAVAWTDSAGTGQIDSAVLNSHGDLPNPLTRTGAPIDDSLRLSAGPDGGYALSWRDGTGEHALAASAGAQVPAPLLGPDVQLAPTDQVVLSGDDSLWLVNDAAGGISATPAVFGQDTTPDAVTIGEALDVTTVGDDAGGLWVLARDSRGWFAAHLARDGRLASTPLPSDAAHPVIALAGTTAVVAYRAGHRCATYVQRIASTATPATASTRTDLTPGASSCSTPTAIAVDPASRTAYVLTSSNGGTILTTESATRSTNRWPGSLRERIDAIVALGSNRVVVESNGPRRDIGEQCGGAADSLRQWYLVRVFHGASLERSGELEASVMNC
ncbi:MAG TPA: hypothetical protein VKG62_03400 [Solirubrobacteraceae bacterium]|nr:hypothetical protein [Solirubrobacteraceae bacterium]